MLETMNERPEDVNSGVSLDTLDYLRGVKSSTCLLLPTTPSPTNLDLNLKHPLAEVMNEGNFLTMDNEPIQNSDVSPGDSSSSADSNSVVQDPVSAQLINNISMLDYQTLSKNGDLIMGQEEECKLNGNMNTGNRKLPNFVNWNWGLIRKVMLWIVLSSLVACLGAIVAMIVTLPKECNPDLLWYQGKVFYEVFPASFQDTNNDGKGDLKGLIKKLDYIQDFGVSAIHVNYIFESQNYPDEYYNSTSLLKIDESLGVVKDFEELAVAVHEKKMYLILDLPVVSMVNEKTLNPNSTNEVRLNDTYIDATSQAITFWAGEHDVDGFYLKNLEDFVDNKYFCRSLQIWKQILGGNKIFIASYNAYEKAKGDSLNVLLSRIDLIDVHLDLSRGVVGLKKHLDGVLSSTLWSLPHYPWVHWNIDNIDSKRIFTTNFNNSLALTVLEFVLPGTISVFYGDEIGLSANDDESYDHDHENVRNLVPMTFSENLDEKIDFPSWNIKSVQEPNYRLISFVKELIKMRLNTPTIYLNGIYKEGNMLKNTEVRKTETNLIVIERWYPRKNTCVFVGNLGGETITTDLSTMFYGGTVIAGTNSSLIGQVLYFDQVTFPPNTAIILKLEK